MIDKEELRSIIEEADELDLPDGAYWAWINDRAGLEYGDAEEMVASDPEFFGWEAKA